MFCRKINSIIIRKSHPTINESIANAIFTINHPTDASYHQSETEFRFGIGEYLRWTDKISFRDLFSDGTEVLIDGVFVDDETHTANHKIYNMITQTFLEG